MRPLHGVVLPAVRSSTSLFVRIEVAFWTLKGNGPRGELEFVWGSWALADNAVYRSH